MSFSNSEDGNEGDADFWKDLFKSIVEPAVVSAAIGGLLFIISTNTSKGEDEK